MNSPEPIDQPSPGLRKVSVTTVTVFGFATLVAVSEAVRSVEVRGQSAPIDLFELREHGG